MKIIHTSDIHLASPLTSKLSGGKAKKRAAELKERFSEICMGAEASGAEAVIIAGDLFDTQRITKSDIDSALSAIEAAKSILQSLLYNLRRMFVVARDDDELDCEQLYWARRGANNALLAKTMHPDWTDQKIISDTVDYLKNIAKGGDNDENE